jgi:hemolysin type calcium-binding protein
MVAASLGSAALVATPAAAYSETPSCRGVPATITGEEHPGYVIKGTPHDDVIVGNGKQNLILAGKGDDLVCGRGNNDLIPGQGGDDALFGQGGNDILLGDAGQDRLNGGSGKTHLNGGTGFDRCLGGRDGSGVAFSGETCERHPGSRSGGLRHFYYLGNNFHRFPLTGFSGRPNFLYGHPHGAWPIEIQIWSACDRWPGAYPRRLDVFPFRGAKAAWNYFGGAFEIYTGRVAIVIFSLGLNRPGLAEIAGRAVGDVTGAGGRRLPPPAKGAMDGSLAC